MYVCDIIYDILMSGKDASNTFVSKQNKVCVGVLMNLQPG